MDSTKPANRGNCIDCGAVIQQPAREAKAAEREAQYNDLLALINEM